MHIGLSKPFRWLSPFPPMKLNTTSHVIIYKHLPYLKPFALITRTLIPNSNRQLPDKQQQSISSTLRSRPISCCTQGCK